MICPRCGQELVDGDEHEEDAAHVRTHRLQKCFDNVKAGQSGEVALLRESIEKDQQTIKELTEQVQARDEELTKAAFEAEQDEDTTPRKKK